MESAVEKLVAVGFLLIGISHMAQARAWSEFFIRIREKGAAGSIQLGLLNLPLALLIIAFHNVWHGLPIIVTVIGWGLLIKSFVYLISPAQALHMLGTISIENSWRFVVGGAVSIAISALILLGVWQSAAGTRP
jgi:hypothetical protein